MERITLKSFGPQRWAIHRNVCDIACKADSQCKNERDKEREVRRAIFDYLLRTFPDRRSLSAWFKGTGSGKSPKARHKDMYFYACADILRKSTGYARV